MHCLRGPRFSIRPSDFHPSLGPIRVPLFHDDAQPRRQGSRLTFALTLALTLT
jgi:hypothetical protein